MSRNIHLLLLLMTCMLGSLPGHAQQHTVSGTLKMADGTPVSHASIVLKNAHRVVAFAMSDEQGSFSLSWPDTVQTPLTIAVNHLGYRQITVSYRPDRNRYDLILEPQAIDLSEVTVRSRPQISLSGDTLRYDVGSFTKTEDRTIGDVIQRLPGLKVDPDGRISYNGKPISHLYVDGDDLLDDKYAIGTKTIPHGMVDQVEVLRNHQPRKVLQGKAISEDVALNLKIKEEAKLALTGQAKPGVGIPELFDGEVNTILFNKSYKMLNAAKANNTGTDLSTELTAFGRADRMNALGRSPLPELLYSGTVSAPALPTNRYYFNRSGSLHANNMVTLNNGLQLRTNIGGWLDRNRLDYYSANDYFLAGDTIHYTENQAIAQTPFLVDATVAAEHNREKAYFNNALRLRYSGGSTQATLLSSTRDMDQTLRNCMQDFSNTLEYIPQLQNGNLLSLNWSVSYLNRPQRLTVGPGFLPSIGSGPQPYERARQETALPTWFSNLALGYQVPDGRIRQSYQLTSRNEWQQLLSDLALTDGGTTLSGQPDFRNQLHWQRHNLQFGPVYEWPSERWEAMLTLPVTWQRIIYRDAGFSIDETCNRWWFNPYLRAKFKTTPQDYLSWSYALNNQTGGIQDVYRGAILTNYRNLQSSQGLLPEQRVQVAAMNYHIQRHLSMLFINGGVSYSRINANTIAATTITDQGSRTERIPYGNILHTMAATGGISKYLFALGAKASLDISWNTTHHDQLINDQLLPYRNGSLTASVQLETRLWDRVSIGYEGTGNRSVSRVAADASAQPLPVRRLTRTDQTLTMLYAPFRNTLVKVTGRHLFARQDGSPDVRYLFADASLRYRVVRWKTDLELSLTNLAALNEYESYYLSDTLYGYSRYDLRGRMALLKATFDF